MAGAFLTVIMAFTLLPSVVFAENANTGVAKIGDQTYGSCKSNYSGWFKCYNN